jgi:hypothetical protein
MRTHAFIAVLLAASASGALAAGMGRVEAGVRAEINTLRAEYMLTLLRNSTPGQQQESVKTRARTLASRYSDGAKTTAGNTNSSPVILAPTQNVTSKTFVLGDQITINGNAFP